MMPDGGTIMSRVGCSAPSDAMLPWLDAEGATLTHCKAPARLSAPLFQPGHLVLQLADLDGLLPTLQVQ